MTLFDTPSFSTLQCDQLVKSLKGRKMPKLKLSISDESKRTLITFKKVVDTIMGKEVDATNYLDLVVSKGIKSMLSDIIPKETDVLWDSIERISEVNPEFMSEFIVEALKKGDQINKQAAQQKLGFIK